MRLRRAVANQVGELIVGSHRTLSEDAFEDSRTTD